MATTQNLKHQRFWDRMDRAIAKVDNWPAWKRQAAVKTRTAENDRPAVDREQQKAAGKE
jgi:hypothetical protein